MTFANWHSVTFWTFKARAQKIAQTACRVAGGREDLVCVSVYLQVLALYYVKHASSMHAGLT